MKLVSGGRWRINRHGSGGGGSCTEPLRPMTQLNEDVNVLMASGRVLYDLNYFQIIQTRRLFGSRVRRRRRRPDGLMRLCRGQSGTNQPWKMRLSSPVAITSLVSPLSFARFPFRSRALNTLSGLVHDSRGNHTGEAYVQDLRGKMRKAGKNRQREMKKAERLSRRVKYRNVPLLSMQIPFVP
ncbi:hypothetical protein CBL_09359 [Carabus blaptoides fortunei]